MNDKLSSVREKVEIKENLLNKMLFNEKINESKIKGAEGNDKIENNSIINENKVDDFLSSTRIRESYENMCVHNEEKKNNNYVSTNNNHKSSSDSNLNEDKNNLSKDENNINEKENNFNENENSLSEDKNNLSKKENNINKKENNLNKNENSLSEDKNNLSKKENNIDEKENNLNENENGLSGSDNYLSADENNVTKEKLDNIKSNYKEEINSNEVNFEYSNFFDNNFFDFQKAKDSLKKNNSLIDIYNEMKNYEEDFLEYLERTYENVEEDGFIKNEEKNSVDHIDFNNIESISSFFNDSSISNINITQVKHCLIEDINFFVEQKKLNKKIKINKNYFSFRNYLNTLPPNPSKKIFKEYEK
ncbi:conserved Plasmodium protein, unknown function [Plasmodium relictum]|uniref:Uncharacterized protein n=1 Tax=Plasmodium relictum TaxID=85471 RepID=A0A1J1H536_PLARL|nr:conserved Plasmodium protein, unknown function [Plasmodium relictum]CRG99801.1 conserved Plasmodium protein, unknown function [Plasmodium relictum]